MLATSAGKLPRVVGLGRSGRRVQPAAALEGRLRTGLFEIRDQPLEVFPMCRRDVFQIDDADLITGGIVLGGEEMGVAVQPMDAYLASGYAEKIVSRGKDGVSW